MKKHIIPQITLILFLSCMTHQSVKTDEMSDNRDLRIDKMIQFSESLLGKKTYSKTTVLEREFTLDCIGTVSAIFWDIGIDIQGYFSQFEGNGVSRLFQYLNLHNRIHHKKLPDAGDVIFWDHTWDKNNDGVMGNDPLTHAGIVMKIDDDETIYFIHANYGSGIVIETMNLKYPDIYKNNEGKILNSYLALGSNYKNHPEKYLTGTLFNSYGRVLE